MVENLPIEKLISKLEEMTLDYWLSWQQEARDLFRKLDFDLWNKTKHNTYEMIQLIPKEDLRRKLESKSLNKRLKRLVEKYDKAKKFENKWYSKTLNTNPDIKKPIVYLSMEFGLHQSLPIYSGGLGVLAGDTCKEASDLGIPFVAIGFLYGQGYFHQKIPSHGWQETLYKKTDFSKIPIKRVLKENGEVLKISVNVGLDEIKIQAWVVHVGIVQLYLLDTDLDENPPWYRTLSSRLYGGDQEMRINQELIIGFGGVELVKKLGLEPKVWHLNEGHTSFSVIQRLVDLVQNGKSYAEAFDLVKKSTVFTTHTPVPAGHDKFPLDLVEQKLYRVWGQLKISRKEFLKLGIDVHSDENAYNMTVLAINSSSKVNGVSKLHTDVTINMWKGLLEQRKDNSKPIAITNGIHMLTWVSGPMNRLFRKYIAEDWISHQDDTEMWKKIDQISDSEFWKTRKKAKNRLFTHIRESARRKRINGKTDAEQLLASGILFDPNVLTIGFARRFASYKRANLIFQDLERLRKILNNPKLPVQIIFAGKAHPADEQGKNILKNVYEEALNNENAGRVAFLEDYDMYSARLLVQGVDLWLNNPIKPHEASGTSGIKAAINGVPHFSILDGWWAEGYNGKNGWIIDGSNEELNDIGRDVKDAESLYDTLENKIIKYYYEQNNGYSEKWVKICKESIKSVAPTFCMTRMIKEYVTKMYLPTFD
jgi:glycogen phosphorylase